MFIVNKFENGVIDYFLADNMSQALEIYQREKQPLIEKYGMKKGYVWDNRILENDEKLETVSSFQNDTATLNISTEKKEEDLNFYLQVHDLSKQPYNLIDER